MYKGQGRIQCELMTRVYLEFLVQGTQFQVPITTMEKFQWITPDLSAEGPAACAIVARVRPRTSKGITDLLPLRLV